MKKYRFHIILLSLFISIHLISCNEDYFDQAIPPANKLLDIWTTHDEVEQLINGAYWTMEGSNNNGAVTNGYVLAGSVPGDLGVIHTGGKALDWTQDVYNRNTNDGLINRIRDVWLGAYFAIQAANDALDAIENNDLEGHPGWESRQKGEAYFIRAYMHFILVRVFAEAYTSNPAASGVILKNEKSGSINAVSGVSTVKEVYDQVISDLNKAIELLPEKYVEGEQPSPYSDRAQKDAARFLLAEVYFQMGQDKWSDALTQINAVLGDGTKYPLGTVVDAFEHDTEGSKGTETIMNYVTYNPNQQGWRASMKKNLFGAINELTKNNSDRCISTSDYFLTTVGWMSNDGNYTETAEAQADKRYTELCTRFEAHEDSLLDRFDYDRPYIWVNKYRRKKLASLPVMRAAQLHLMRAAIYSKTGAGSPAADVNAVRQRAGLSDLASPTFDDIVKEYMKEMIFEGKWLFFLQAINDTNWQLTGGDRASTSTIDPRTFYWVIPEAETNTNPNFD